MDFLRRTVRIEHQADEKTREIVILKTESSRRTIPLPQWVANALAAHLAAFPAGHDVECTCQGNACSQVASGLLFHTAVGTALDQGYYRHRVFDKALAKVNATIREANAKLPAGAARAAELSVTTHDLRHHFASML